MSSTWWQSLKFVFWPPYRRRYQEAMLSALRRRQAKVQAQIAAKYGKESKIAEQARQMVRSSLAHASRAIDTVRSVSEAERARQQAETLQRISARLEEMRPLLVRERRLDMLAEAERVIKARQEREAARRDGPRTPPST